MVINLFINRSITFRTKNAGYPFHLNKDDEVDLVFSNE